MHYESCLRQLLGDVRLSDLHLLLLELGKSVFPILHICRRRPSSRTRTDVLRPLAYWRGGRGEGGLLLGGDQCASPRKGERRPPVDGRHPGRGESD